MTSPRPKPIEEALASTEPSERASLEEAWDAVARHGDAPTIDADALATLRGELRRFAENSGSRRYANRSPVRRVQTGGRRVWRWTIAAVLVLLAATTYWLAQPVRYAPSEGQTLRVQLPDGSDVALARGSELRHARWFALFNRSVTLDGIAFFAVEAGRGTFRVQTERAEAAVMGTRFELHETPASARLQVEEGRVVFSRRGAPDESVTVSAGEISTLSDGPPTPPEAAPDSLVPTWRLQTLLIQSKALSEVAEILSAAYNIEVQVSESALRSSRTLSYFAGRPLPLERVLHDICQITQCSYRRTTSGFEIFRTE